MIGGHSGGRLRPGASENARGKSEAQRQQVQECAKAQAGMVNSGPVRAHLIGRGFIAKRFSEQVK